MDYKTSGVDIEAGRAFIDQIRSSVEATNRSEVISGMGGFGGLIRLPEGFSRPVLVAGTDGVGTKLELAQEYQAHFGVGIDLVAMCVNDVITSAAQPLFFLDYLATGSLSPESMAKVVEGIAEGCLQSGCVLLGGETAEMPGFYPQGRYDLAGFCVGIAEESLLVDGSKISAGDQIIGVSSSGIHSNGFSLVRKVLDMKDVNGNNLFGDEKMRLVDQLLRPTNIYWRLVKRLLDSKFPINGMAHITGGGLPENLPRCLPKGLLALLDPASWEIPDIFLWLKDVGEIPDRDFWNTFNLGIGFCLVVPNGAYQAALDICQQVGFEAWLIGQVEEASGSEGFSLKGLLPQNSPG